jgi:heat shock protein 90kDa beta
MRMRRFLSSKTGDFVTLDDYVSRLKEGQDQIFYLAGSSKEAVEKSPLLERVLKRGYPVLFFLFINIFLSHNRLTFHVIKLVIS